MKKNSLEPVKKRLTTVGKSPSPDSKVVKVKTETGGLGGLKTLIVIAIIGVQLAFLIFLNVRFAFAVKWVMIASFVLSLLTCVYVLSSNKNSLSKAVWIIFLLLGFSFGYIIYFLSDERIFFAKARRRYNGVYKNAEQYIKKSEMVKSENPSVQNDCKYLETAGKFTCYQDTAVEYFPSGYLFFESLLERLKTARKFIFIEYFIVSDGNLLNRFIDILKERTNQGVTVRLIYDDMGSHKTLSLKSKNRLKKAGVSIMSFNRLVPIFSVALNYRDHRKMVIIDGETAYSGGCNLADEYVNEKRMYGYWKDTGIKLDGKAVDGFTLVFLRQWEYLVKKREDYSQFINLATPKKSSSVVVPYADGLDYALPIGKNVYENMISGANEKIYIMTPYFILDDTMTNLLINKSLSGVDVRIILPEVPDKAFVYGVSRNNAEKLIDYGVKVYCMKHSFVHSKLLLTENSVVVGSINMDLRSFYQQFECAVYTDDKGVMDSVMDDFTQTIELSVLITENNKMRKNIFYRAFAALMQVFAPFM